MNKVYALKYCVFRQAYIAVSELTVGQKKKSSTRRKKALLALLISGVAFGAHASSVREDIPYQIWRDFAENKGQFTPGATNVKIFKKDGTLLTTMEEPIPDFSYANHAGVSSLINPQYVSTAKHTKGQWAVTSKFGGSGNNPDYHRYTYKSIRYNDEPITYDYSFHRLNKLVADVVPISIIDMKRSLIPFRDSKRYPIFARMGNGNQAVIDINGVSTSLAQSRVYLTGGTFGRPDLNTAGGQWDDITISYLANSAVDYLYKMFPDKLVTRGESGDSGSSLIVWDSQEKKWFLAGQFYGGSSISNRWSIPNNEFIKNGIASDDLSPFITSGTSKIKWEYDSVTANGKITQEQHTLAMTGASGTDNLGLDNGKNITFYGTDGTIILLNDINQGAGSLDFKGNYVISPSSNQTWMGGGINIGPGKLVTWQVNGVQGDSLHKIGEGTLIVNAKGINKGDLRVGDGTVILDQDYDNTNTKQAFNNIDIVSGRSTVILNDSNQVNPNKIYFGYRGGRLDLNGNHLTFERIHNVDNGAQIVNHNSGQDSRASVEITGTSAATKQTFQGILGETDESKINGKLSLEFKPINPASMMVLAGGSNLNGDMNVEKGTLILSGRPVIHAKADNTAGSQINDGEDWVHSDFKVNELYVWDGAHLQVSNSTEISSTKPGGLSEISLIGNASAVLGYHNDSNEHLGSYRCYLDDNNGQTNCSKPKENEISPSAITKINANINLENDDNILQLGQVYLRGAINDTGDSSIYMDPNSQWKVTGDSNLSKVRFDNSYIDLGSDAISDSWIAKSLTIKNFSSIGSIVNFGVHAVTKYVDSDTLIIKEAASGIGNLIHITTVPYSLQENLPESGLTLVTAPEGTNHNLFDFAAKNIGFSTIKPLSKVITDNNDGNKVKWLILPNTSKKDLGKINALFNSTGLKETMEDEKVSSWMGARDNYSLLNDTKALLQTRQFAVAESLAHLTDRAVAIRTGGETDGLWGTIRQDKGEHTDRSLFQTAITIGADRTDGISTTGFMANITRGRDTGGEGREEHIQAGFGIYNSLGDSEGLFIDSALSYQLYHQKLSYSSLLGELPGKSNSNMILLSARAGYRFEFAHLNTFVEPVFGMDTGYLSGYTHSNNVDSIEQESGVPVYAVAGLRISKHWGKSASKGTTLMFSALRHESIDGSGAGIKLSDAYKKRDYAAEQDNRNRFDLSLKSNLTDNITAKASVGYSTGNSFHTDYSGLVGIKYSF